LLNPPPLLPSQLLVECLIARYHLHSNKIPIGICTRGTAGVTLIGRNYRLSWRILLAQPRFTLGALFSEGFIRGVKNPLAARASGPFKRPRGWRERRRVLRPLPKQNILSEFNCGRGALDIHTLRVRQRVRQCVRPES